MKIPYRKWVHADAFNPRIFRARKLLRSNKSIYTTKVPFCLETWLHVKKPMGLSLMKGRGRNHCNLAIYIVVIWQLNSAINFNWRADLFPPPMKQKHFVWIKLSLSRELYSFKLSPTPLDYLFATCVVNPVLLVLTILGNGDVLIGSVNQHSVREI